MNKLFSIIIVYTRNDLSTVRVEGDCGEVCRCMRRTAFVLEMLHSNVVLVVGPSRNGF